jgi:hypothetical protein
MPFDIGHFFTILDPSKPADRLQITREFGAQKRSTPIRRTLDLLLPLCKTVVVEREYIDSDFRASYARFYIFSQLDTDRRCRRVHFFAAPLRTEDAMLGATTEGSGYLGYIILRPFKKHAFGRSVLSEQVLWAACPPGCEVYLTSRARHRANLAGAEVEIMGAPWMQQDTMVAACASASIWMTQWHMAHRFAPDFRLFFTSQITDLAVQVGGGHALPMPSEGLSTEQMIHALTSIGYDPVPVEPVDAETARSALYQYVDSGIPVIVSLDYPELLGKGEDVDSLGHTVVAVGYTVDRKIDPRPYKYADFSFTRASDFAAHFVVQDDAVAPFCMLEILDWESAANDELVLRKHGPVFENEEMLKEAKAHYPCVVVLDRGNRATERVGWLNTFIVPLPSGITLSCETAEERAVNVVASWYKKAGRVARGMVVRTFLQLSNDLKAHWSKTGHMPRDLGVALRRHVFSRWVWVTEVSTYEQFCAARGHAIGQVIQDSASRGDASPVYLAHHMPPEDLRVTEPSGKVTFVAIKPYTSFVGFLRPGGRSPETKQKKKRRVEKSPK